MAERVEQATLFGVEPPKTKEDRAREDRIARKAFKERITKQLLDLAREALRADLIAEGPGIAFYTVRHMAETRGWLRGDESGEVLSMGSGLMRKAGAHVVGHVTSKHRNTKGRLVALWKIDPPPIGEVAG